MADPLVSVVIPTHNRPTLLMERALPSVLKQTYRQLDVHVVGDGTDPVTVRLMESIDDPRVRFTNLPKQELPEDPGTAWCVLGLEARNYGQETAKGEFIINLDDDDELMATMVETLMRHLVSADADVAYGRSKAFRPDGAIAWYGNWPPRHFAFCDGAWLSRHDLHIRYDPECVARGLPADGDRIDRMVAAGLRFTFVDEIVHYYYPHRV